MGQQVTILTILQFFLVYVHRHLISNLEVQAQLTFSQFRNCTKTSLGFFFFIIQFSVDLVTASSSWEGQQTDSLPPSHITTKSSFSLHRQKGHFTKGLTHTQNSFYSIRSQSTLFRHPHLPQRVCCASSSSSLTGVPHVITAYRENT